MSEQTEHPVNSPTESSQRPAPHRSLLRAQLQVLGDGMNKIRGSHVGVTIRRGGRLRCACRTRWALTPRGGCPQK